MWLMINIIYISSEASDYPIIPNSFKLILKRMTSKFLAELSSDYEKLFETEIGYDVIIYAGEEPNVKEIHAHSNILCIRSKYFRSAFSNEWAEKDGKFILRKSN